MKQKYKDCSVIILAAGHSSRMGSPKFALPFNKNSSFLEEIINQYNSFGCKKIVVVLNGEGISYIHKQAIKFSNNVVFVTNSHLEWERFYSIKLGIENLSNDFPVFIHNVDNPFVNQDVLSKLFSNSTANFIAPIYQGSGGHPILLSEKVGDKILSEKKNDIILSDFLKRFKKTTVEVNDKNILVNINTLKGYKFKLN